MPKNAFDFDKEMSTEKRSKNIFLSPPLRNAV